MRYVCLHFFYTQWGCTLRRFGKSDLGCVFCDQSDFGGIEHLLICPTLQNVILEALRQRHIFITLDTLINFRYNGSRLYGISRDFVAIYIYLAIRAFNCIRHGKILDKRLISFISKRLAAHCNGFRKIFRRLQYCEFTFGLMDI